MKTCAYDDYDTCAHSIRPAWSRRHVLQLSRDASVLSPSYLQMQMPSLSHARTLARSHARAKYRPHCPPCRGLRASRHARWSTLPLRGAGRDRFRTLARVFLVPSHACPAIVDDPRSNRLRASVGVGMKEIAHACMQTRRHACQSQDVQEDTISCGLWTKRFKVNNIMAGTRGA